MPRISAIIPAYNAAKTIEATLESVRRQSYKDWEIVLVDDGSKDETAQLVERLIPKFGGRLRYHFQANQGISAARNTAIQHSTGEFLAILDSDDIWLEQRLERSVAEFEKSEKIGLVHGRVARIDTKDEIIGYPRPSHPSHLAGKIARNIYTRRAHLLSPTISFRRDAVDAVGMFDETMRITEDRDLWFRIAEKYETAYIDEVIAHYRISPNSASKNREQMFKWQTYFIEKHRSAASCGDRAYSQAMANIHRERGDSIFREDLRQSIQSYWRAVRYDPTNLPNLYMLARAIAEPALRRQKPPARDAAGGRP